MNDLRCPTCGQSTNKLGAGSPGLLEFARIAGSTQNNQQIAELLGCTLAAVKMRLNRLFKFCGARNRIQFALWYDCELFRIGLESLCGEP